MTVLGWAGAMCVVLAVVGYWAYTLGGVDALAPLMRQTRQRVVALGCLLSGLALLGDGLSLMGAGPVVIAAPLMAYAVRRQWLFPKTAPRLASTEMMPRPEDLVAVLPDGNAVALRWLAKLRTARVENLLLVHCGLSRSLAAFRAPSGDVAAVLPHPTGFLIGTRTRTWDGVDGLATDGGSSLEAVPIRLMTQAAWRLRWPSAGLMAPVGATSLPPIDSRFPRLPGARGVPDPLAWGRVSAGRWEAHDPSSDEQAGRFLARWAALRRGLAQR